MSQVSFYPPESRHKPAADLTEHIPFPLKMRHEGTLLQPDGGLRIQTGHDGSYVHVVYFRELARPKLVVAITTRPMMLHAERDSGVVGGLLAQPMGSGVGCFNAPS